MITRLAAVLACLLATAAFATPAAADTPTRSHYPNNATFPVTGLCTFPVVFSVVADWTETNFFDRGGVMIRQKIHIDEQDTLFANGKTLVGLPFSYNVEIQFSGGSPTSIVATGVSEKIWLPDGTLFIAAGWTNFLAHPGVNFIISPDKGNPGNVLALCAALAP